MKKIFFTKNAEDDIKSIFYFNSALNKSFAKKIQQQIYHEIRILTIHPYSAPIEPLLHHKTETFRSLIIVGGRYKVIYVVKEDSIHIYVIFDCRRNPANIK